MPNPGQRKPRECQYCSHFSPNSLFEMGLCECISNLDHYKHFLAPEHSGCGSWEDRANPFKETILDKLYEVPDED